MANRWLTLAALCSACIICAGLIPGQSLFIEMFVQAGVSAYKCTEAGEELGCSAQYDDVAVGFNIGQMVSLIGLLPGGMLYDLYGGRGIALLGYSIAIFGTLLVLIPVYGAAHGYDASTAVMLPVALLFTDTGALLNSYFLYDMVWFFADFQTLIVALITGTYFFAGFLPNIMEYTMKHTGCSLFIVLLGFLAAMLLGIIICFILVPTREEVRTKAKEALGVAIPKPPKKCTLCKDLKHAHQVLRVHLMDHLFLGTCVAVAFGFNVIYLSLLGEYGKLILNSKEAEDRLPNLSTVILSIVGGVFSPCFGVIADKTNHSGKALSALLSITCAISTATVLGTTYLSQEICITCCTLFQAFFQIVITRRCVDICLPNCLGTVTGVYCFYLIIAAYLWIGAIYAWQDSVGPEELKDVMFDTSAIGSLFMVLGTLRTFVYGEPQGPVFVADDEADISSAFGCKTLKDVLYVMHMEDTHDARRNLLKRMRSTDPKDFERLLSSVDTDRVDELAGSEPLKVAHLAGPTTNGSASTVLSLLDEDAQPGADVPDEPDVTDRPDMWHYQASRQNPGDQLTLCSFTCESRLGSDVLSRTLSCGALPPHRFFCPQVSNQHSHIGGPRMGAASQPLLAGHRESPYAGDAVPSAEALLAEAARALNRRIIEAIAAGDKEAVLGIYENEDTNKLWEAYKDLADNMMTEKGAMDKFEADLEELIDEDEWKELAKRRPALVSLGVKTTAYRMKKGFLG